MVALTRAVPPSIDRCELTHLARTRIDYARAVAEHESYERCLERLGCRIQRLADAPDLPDSVFVEDAAIVFDRIAVIARPGAESRRAEIESVADAVRVYRPLARIEPPGTLDGGDVLATAQSVFVGASGRTNEDGARQLARILAPLGLRVTPVDVRGCLHLKSAVTLAGPSMLLLNPDWIDRAHFSGFDLVEIDPGEPFAANVLRAGDTVVCAAEHPRTRARLNMRGLRTVIVPAGELAKAEGGLTCGSILVD
jgi:dimethylargininase